MILKTMVARDILGRLKCQLNRQDQELRSASKTATLNRDFQCVQEWGQRWLVSFNSSKNNGLFHSRSRDRSQHPCLQMSGSNLAEQEAISLLGLTVCNDLSWRPYLQSILMQATQHIGCLHCVHSEPKVF